jgi:predicted RNA-binding protein YlxR (DUF448 family)
MRTPPNERLGSDIPDASAGRKQAASAPERRCILSGEVSPKETLIRLAISPDGDVLPDLLARAPGRHVRSRAHRSAFLSNCPQ